MREPKRLKGGWTIETKTTTYFIPNSTKPKLTWKICKSRLRKRSSSSLKPRNNNNNNNCSSSSSSNPQPLLSSFRWVQISRKSTRHLLLCRSCRLSTRWSSTGSASSKSTRRRWIRIWTDWKKNTSRNHKTCSLCISTSTAFTCLVTRRRRSPRN